MKNTKHYVLLSTAVLGLYLGLNVVHASTLVTLFSTGIIVSGLALAFGVKWDDIEKGILESMGKMSYGMLLLLIVGALIGSWILSGVVPILVYYGLKMISPGLFLIIALFASSIMSVFTGTSWGTIGTIGIALMGVAEGLGVPLHYAAAAIISGAMFGDKLSPMSDTTITAPTMAGCGVVEHVKHMLWTTIPAYIVAIILYVILGFSISTSGSASGGDVANILNTLDASFNLNPILLLIPVLTLVLIIKKVPVMLSLIIGVIAGLLAAVVFQGANVSAMATAIGNGFTSETGFALVDKMLTRGGISSMLGTLGLFIAAAVFGGPLKGAGVLDFLLEKARSTAKTWKSLMLSLYVVNFAVKVVTGSYYALFTMMGPLEQPLMDEYKLPRKNLSRMMEDVGTAPSWIIPWTASSIYAVGTLGVSVMDFAIWSPLTYMGMIFAVIYVIIGFKPAFGLPADFDSTK